MGNEKRRKVYSSQLTSKDVSNEESIILIGGLKVNGNDANNI